MKKGLSILALSLSLVATAASARFCPSPAYIKKQSYQVSQYTEGVWVFASQDKNTFVYLNKGKTFKEANVALQNVLHDIHSLIKIDYGHCIYKGDILSGKFVWPSRLPTVVYL